MKAYKLTNHNYMTNNHTLWGVNVTHKATGSQTQDLCSDGWIHFYTDPLIAVLMNPKHANFSNPILWEGEACGTFKHESLKSGCESFTTIKKIPLPTFTIIQRVAFGILCSLESKQTQEYKNWARNWLNGIDRTSNAAATACADAAGNAASVYATSAVSAAADAADADDDYAVAAAVHVATGHYAAAAAVYAAAAYAAEAADAVAYAADATDKSINFVGIAKKALTYT